MKDITVYINLHETVLAYKHGDKTKAQEIVLSFSDFLWRYVNLIHRGYFKLEDKPLRRFISLFSCANSKSIDQYNYKKSVKTQLTDSSIRIKALFEQYEEDEIRNELACILLNMAKKYSDYERPSFHTYVERCFHFEAFRGLKNLITDPISRQDYIEYTDFLKSTSSEDIDILNEKIDKINAIKETNSFINKEDIYSEFDDELLNDNWIKGITCSEIFKCLTPFERKILIEHNVNKKTDSDIGQEYGLCRATINRKRLSAIEKLKTSLI